ncbi:flagellin [Bradyrhizobium sp. LMTR 3]|uniref:flagellin N-terminal helical domain-containing protein n=1 Tax=Bradyrhizobium sp. LMTR 3 TaxID=189873 RepID=UPI0008109473|nr:flagellin [Bradyrhizobium sp. LMTR 3]OCK60236.1 flagellar protein [Bradyrhizobium sp. LMTR 3]
MSGIVLSASVRQNLLSLQSTAELLSTTQNRLATGKKVNTALDNPTNFFTAASLDNRASDINNLLDGVSNGVQVLQAANTGISSLQKLVDSAKSVANQALQAAVGYSAKSSVTTTAITGATATDLRGTVSAFTNTTATAGAVLYSAAATPATGATLLSGLTTNAGAAQAIAAGDTVTINGATITFAAGAGALAGAGAAWTLGVDTSLTNFVAALDQLQGNTTNASTITGGGAIQLNTGLANNLAVTGSAGVLTALGLTAAAANTATRGGGTSALNGLTLTIGATGNGTATNITFGDGTGGTVKSLNDLNNALAANNLQASLDSSGRITITTTNDAASSTIGTVGGTAAGGGAPFNGLAGAAPVADPAAQLIRSNLVAQYNNILDQISSTAQDASYNGINLLNGDQLKLTFNETGKSTLTIQGVSFGYTGLGLSKLTAGTDFLDNASANSAITALSTASGTLRTQASALGSNLSIVQIRQDFSKNLINVLQTGSSNLTLADTNEEAANSQALSTRQSIAVSALALANQSQQSVLQLLR